MAAFGGLTVLEIKTSGSVKVRSADVSDAARTSLNRNLLMFYTNTSRSAAIILSGQDRDIKNNIKAVVENMHYIKETGYKILEAVESGNITEVGLLFHKHWQHKKRLSPLMSSPYFDGVYDAARRSGALGGKLVGAGGGGFFVFYIEKDPVKLRRVMAGLGMTELRYGFDSEGTKVL